MDLSSASGSPSPRDQSHEQREAFQHSHSNSMPKVRKVVLVGEEEVGKTSIYVRLRRDIFDEHRISTRGMDNCDITLTDASGGQSRTIKLWDTAGSERYGTLTMSYYRDSVVALLVFAVDIKLSLPRLQQWLADVKMYAPNAYFILVGNKWDLMDSDHPDHLDRASASQFMANHSRELQTFVPVSAKTGFGMEDLKQTVHSLLLGRENAEARARNMQLPTQGNALVDDEVLRLSNGSPTGDDSKERSCCRKG